MRCRAGVANALVGCLALAALVAWAGCSRRPQRLMLAGNGRPNGVIIVAEGASKGVFFAAAELERYLEKISGARFPIKSDGEAARGHLILVGDSGRARASGVSAAGLAPEGFRIKTVDGNLILLGKDEAGTQFAVYTFLEKYRGLRWLWPGESGEVALILKRRTSSGAIGGPGAPCGALRPDTP